MSYVFCYSGGFHEYCKHAGESKLVTYNITKAFLSAEHCSNLKKTESTDVKYLKFA